MCKQSGQTDGLCDGTTILNSVAGSGVTRRVLLFLVAGELLTEHNIVEKIHETMFEYVAVGSGL